MLEASAQHTVLQIPHWTLNVSGTIQSRKVSFSPLPSTCWVVPFSQNFSSPLALYAQQGFGRGRGCAWDVRTPQSLSGRKRGVNLVRGRVVTLIPGVAYIKVAPVSGCVR
ncbi:hypothetical protein TNIN_396081 [Trichonephila inaurata madagascariensis]|uniref:Uncharacterized protein n=1 Tax=Trichonephila inaurata madagascariensis TaxID=2747483 RepID=A0A8X6WYZ7_9ARAC|nr:hypothetical protein TNIN_396081 [Trichonephila inaurata madagascariensis]